MSIDHNRIKVADLEKGESNKILITNSQGELEFGEINNDWQNLRMVINKTYSELQTLIANSQLVVGQKYLLTDYMTTYTQPVTYVHKESGVVEPLILTAVNTNSFDVRCTSELYPQDIVYYSFTADIGDGKGTQGFTKGKIYRRIDQLQNNDIGTDWRHVKYYRGGVDKLLFQNYAGCQNNVIKTYYLFNAVVGHSFYSNTIGNSFYSNTIGNSFNANTIGNSFTGNTIGNSFTGNTIGNSFTGNIIGNSFTENTIGNSFIGNTIGNDFYSNTIGINFLSNTIGNDFYSNTIGNDFFFNNLSLISISFNKFLAADLPTSVEFGQEFYVTNALSPTYNSVVVGGGSSTVKVFYDGSNWICN